MLARGIDQILAEPCDPKLYENYVKDARDYIAIAEEISGPIPRNVPPTYPWGDALAVLQTMKPDARIINLETSITRRGDPDREKGIHYRVSPANAACLRAAGIDVCTLGNNHVLDWGTEGLADTLDTLDALGIRRCGAGRDLAEAVRPAVIELANGQRIVVFSIGCADAGVPGRHRDDATPASCDRAMEELAHTRGPLDPLGTELGVCRRSNASSIRASHDRRRRRGRRARSFVAPHQGHRGALRSADPVRLR
jgi:poly-gamma-glutamate synthesis protein (capsule biosynthesis protein)